MRFLLKAARYLFALGPVTLPSSLAQDRSGAPGDKETLAKAAIIGCSANVNAFPFYQCRWRITKAQAKSVEDAVGGKFLNALSSDHRLLVDGDKDLYEGLTAALPPDFKQAIPFPGRNGLFLVPAPLRSDSYLSDGKRELNFVPQLSAANLWSRDKAVHGIEETPLGLVYLGHRNRFGPDFLARSEEFEMASDGLEEIEGRAAITVRFRNLRDQSMLRFSFDAARGYLPIRMTYFMDGKLRTQVFVTEIRECSHQRWFPERFVEIDTPGRADLPYDVKEVQLLDLDADQRPDARDFAFTHLRHHKSLCLCLVTG